jgi:hypothetical protein
MKRERERERERELEVKLPKSSGPGRDYRSSSIIISGLKTLKLIDKSFLR